MYTVCQHWCHDSEWNLDKVKQFLDYGSCAELKRLRSPTLLQSDIENVLLLLYLNCSPLEQLAFSCWTRANLESFRFFESDFHYMDYAKCVFWASLTKPREMLACSAFWLSFTEKMFSANALFFCLCLCFSSCFCKGNIVSFCSNRNKESVGREGEH